MAVVLLRGGVVRVVESESAVAEEEAAARPGCCWWPCWWPGGAGGRALLLPLHSLPPQHKDPTVTLPAAAAQPARNARVYHRSPPPRSPRCTLHSPARGATLHPRLRSSPSCHTMNARVRFFCQRYKAFSKLYLFEIGVCCFIHWMV